VKGKVKWFSHEKGFGFIVSEQGQDHYFGVRDIVGAELPNNLDDVEFETRHGKKGPAATKVAITAKANIAHSGKSTCPQCDIQVYPRMVTNYGSPDRSFCPECGAVLKDFVDGFTRFLRLFF